MLSLSIKQYICRDSYIHGCAMYDGEISDSLHKLTMNTGTSSDACHMIQLPFPHSESNGMREDRATA